MRHICPDGRAELSIISQVRQFLGLLYRSGGPHITKEGELEALVLLTGKAPIEPKPTPILSEQVRHFVLDRAEKCG